MEMPNFRRNYVSITGYLKESSLKHGWIFDGREAIWGNLIIATTESESFKIQFSAYRKDKSGADNKKYFDLNKLLSNKIVSINSYVSNNPKSTFQEAAQHSEKLWVRAIMEEYARLGINDDEITSVVLTGQSVVIKPIDCFGSFVPEATYDMDMFIESINKEKVSGKNNGEITERLVVSGLFPNYRGMMNRVSFVVPCGKLSDFVLDNYKVGDTANFSGKLVGNTFGTINECQIFGRCAGHLPIRQGENGSITPEEVKTGLALRDEHIAETTDRFRHPMNFSPVRAACCN